MHFRQEFGSPSVFTLEGSADDAAYERFDTANRNRSNPLFDASLSHSKLSRRMRHGEIRHIIIPEEPEDIDAELDGSIPTSDESKVRASLETNGELPVENSSEPGEPKELYNKDDLKLFAIDADGKLYV
jgi:hypothetical protein